MEHNRRRTDKLENASDHDLLIQHSGKIDALCKTVLENGKANRNFHKKFDDFISPEGPFMTVKTFQASCPRDNIWRTIGRQWKALFLLASLTCTAIIKAFWKDVGG